MLNVATSRAMPENTSRNVLKNDRKSAARSLTFSSVSRLPVIVSNPAGNPSNSRRTGPTRAASSS